MSTAAPPCAADPWAPRPLPGPGAPEGAEVWLLDLDAGPGAPLSPEEDARAARFATPRLARRFAAAHAGLRRILAAYLGAEPGALVFATGALGKPRLAGALLEFNLSHSGGRALVAVARGPVGVDIEEIAPAPPYEIAPLAFTAPEWRDIAARSGAARAARFYEGWCRKEALAKARGLGLSLDATELPAFAPEAPGGWRVMSLPGIPGHAAALATPGPRALRLSRPA